MKAITALVILGAAAAASGQATETRQHRIIPIRAMSEDVEVLYGDPEAVGQPFVMRIRELEGGVIPPHKHPVDEHITVLQGTLFFGVGEKFDRAAMKEVKAGGYVFIPAGSTLIGYTPDAQSFRSTVSGRSTSTGVTATLGRPSENAGRP